MRRSAQTHTTKLPDRATSMAATLCLWSMMTQQSFMVPARQDARKAPGLPPTTSTSPPSASSSWMAPSCRRVPASICGFVCSDLSRRDITLRSRGAGGACRRISLRADWEAGRQLAETHRVAKPPCFARRGLVRRLSRDTCSDAAILTRLPDRCGALQNKQYQKCVRPQARQRPQSSVAARRTGPALHAGRRRDVARAAG